jgi:hypothetical protein
VSLVADLLALVGFAMLAWAGYSVHPALGHLVVGVALLVIAAACNQPGKKRGG